MNSEQSEKERARKAKKIQSSCAEYRGQRKVPINTKTRAGAVSQVVEHLLANLKQQVQIPVPQK
jgi:hypothetical protein